MALRIAIRSAATSAPPKPSIETPGTIAAATNSAAALTSHETTSRTGWNFGRSGCHVICSPYAELAIAPTLHNASRTLSVWLT